MLERIATCPVETRLIAGARHAPHLEARQATLDAIVPFVRSVSDGGGGMIDFQTEPSRYRHWRLRSTDRWRR